MKFIDREKRKIEKSARELWIRRLNWRVCTRSRVEKEFSLVETMAKGASFPFRVFSQSNSLGSNEETVQLTFGYNPTGVSHKELKITGAGKSYRTENGVEKGCCLVVSQAVNGSVAFIMYPYESDRTGKTEENIIIYSHLHPNDVTTPLIQKAIKRFFLYARTSSVYGMGTKPSLIEELPIYYLTYRDIRNRKDLFRPIAGFVSEWGKAIVAATVAYLFAKYVGKA